MGAVIRSRIVEAVPAEIRDGLAQKIGHVR
jgi:hypothetical protein